MKRHSLNSPTSPHNSKKWQAEEKEKFLSDPTKVHQIYLLAFQKVIHDAQVELTQNKTAIERKIETSTGKQQSI